MTQALWNIFVALVVLKLGGIGEYASVGWGWILSPLIIMGCLKLWVSTNLSRFYDHIAKKEQERSKELIDKIMKDINRSKFKK